ncbi:MAG: UDP-N-acetylglucosamine 1-carboxyvinyltransferase [Meiothermus sp.]|uniref:UDP-N-acetylglucosamine 1-carboxyvinyltransferase n=2 Tax=Meiothermus hypogaeus TaxID=884155 RepID=A0A511R2V4_9DEIN|nr:UDP-N-acetylglucosamine 1-carboxyvinyltransferase [Meiothermus hypogaeus]RIH80142.1 UDP-N-acetylglucosamine 1-carboxyvinyltransferase [Meiothermus hypogaeus]GEM83948.1 UDP-N-acetylglucosamine 1-carboxyvinyltransferase [Meiothermus hypogaeus NBRC 106114]GIW37690.1 MAG: UDP-N-acetylglucosamine 1-carboxyvinyltransferase [Meiothermus sp.]
MDRTLIIRGGIPLSGDLRIFPAKNSALKLMAASILTAEPVTLAEVPRLRDIDVLLELLGHLGTRHAWEGRTLHLHTPEIRSTQAPFELVSKMRASFNVLGALAARAGEGTVPLPGGCNFAERPVDQHIKALRGLGFEVSTEITEQGVAYTVRRHKPASGRVVYDLPTLGGTEQALMAAALGGEAVLVNTPQEPEIVDLCNFLSKMGAEIKGIGSSILHIKGKPSLRGVSYSVIPDRIEAGTYLFAAAATRGSITLSNVEPFHMDAVLDKLIQSGHRITTGKDWIRLESTAHPQPFNLEAREYPGFITDLQPPAAAYLATVHGTSLVSDRVYPDRFTHASELARMGADVTLKDRTLIIQGRQLTGAAVEARDIRAGGGLIIAALAAEGESHIAGMKYIERGYDDIENRLRCLGAQVGVQVPELALAAD